MQERLARLWDLKLGDQFRFQGEAVQYKLLMEADEIGCCGFETVLGRWYDEQPASRIVLVKV